MRMSTTSRPFPHVADAATRQRSVELDSGIDMSRADAHRLYFDARYRIKFISLHARRARPRVTAPHVLAADAWPASLA